MNDEINANRDPVQPPNVANDGDLPPGYESVEWSADQIEIQRNHIYRPMRPLDSTPSDEPPSDEDLVNEALGHAGILGAKRARGAHTPDLRDENAEDSRLRLIARLARLRAELREAREQIAALDKTVVAVATFGGKLLGKKITEEVSASHPHKEKE